MSDSLHPRARIDWGLVLALVSIIVGGVVAFTVVREQGNNNTASIAALNASDGKQNDVISKMREDRSIETKINDLTLEVRLLRQEVQQSNNKKRQ